MSAPTHNPTAARSLKSARVAVVSAFAIAGFVLATWVVNIPSVEARTGISHGTLGTLLLFIGLGAFIGMQVSGPLTDRFGGKSVTIAGGILSCAAVVLPALATNAPTLGVALFVFGLGHGMIDVGMNSQAVEVERAYGRPIMSSFHAFFSLGGAAGAVLGSALIAVHLPLVWALTIPALIALAGLAVLTPFLIPHTPVQVDGAETAAPTRNRMTRSIWMLGAIAFLLMLAEGAANDWSALQIRQHLDASPASAGYGFAAFSVTMTIGRLVADRVVTAIGPVRVVRFGALTGALGLLLVVLAPVLALNLLGWGLLGIGLSGCVPQIFTAAGNLPDGTQGVNISRVVGMGYLGLLAGPAVVGWVSELTSITEALLIPLVFCAAASALAGALRRPGGTRPTGTVTRTADQVVSPDPDLTSR
ncbi:MFS transporter [Nakamurella silvestris]|nr:MFS transporter [Nakamurella silvestris]